jgi:hypothetical protein
MNTPFMLILFAMYLQIEYGYITIKRNVETWWFIVDQDVPAGNISKHLWEMLNYNLTFDKK